jgi:hypothetical protein
MRAFSRASSSWLGSVAGAAALGCALALAAGCAAGTEDPTAPPSPGYPEYPGKADNIGWDVPANAGGGGSAEGDGGGGSGGGAGGEASCPLEAPNTCQSALGLGAIAGDEWGDSVVFTGTTSMWLELLVAEEYWNSVDIGYAAWLDSPAGAFELVIYEGQPGGLASCNALPIKAKDGSHWSSWPDEYGFDDSVWLVLEIRQVASPGCNPEDEWILTVEGGG